MFVQVGEGVTSECTDLDGGGWGAMLMVSNLAGYYSLFPFLLSTQLDHISMVAM